LSNHLELEIALLRLQYYIDVVNGKMCI